MSMELDEISVLGDEFEFEVQDMLHELGDVEDQTQLTPEQLSELGANSPSWLMFLDGKNCKAEYIKRLNHFLLYHVNKQFWQTWIGSMRRSVLVVKEQPTKPIAILLHSINLSSKRE